MKVGAMKTILLIEDDISLLKLYTKILTDAKYSVIQAINGKNGLQLLQQQIPDLVVLDVVLPGGMNGFDVLEEIRREERLKKLPVIILTNLDSEKKVAGEIGANLYLVKTETSSKQFLEHIQSLIGR